MGTKINSILFELIKKEIFVQLRIGKKTWSIDILSRNIINPAAQSRYIVSKLKSFRSSLRLSRIFSTNAINVSRYNFYNLTR